MKQIFFDANVWIDYSWRRNFSRTTGRHKKKALLIHNLKTTSARVTLTFPLLYEISSHFKDYSILQDMLADGFGAFEFSKIKRDYRLNRAGRRKVDDIYNQIVDMGQTQDQILVNWLNEKNFEKVFKLTGGYEIDFLDAIHVVAASIANCNIFVTKDESLLKRIESASRKFKKLQNIDFVTPNKFKQKYSTLFKK